MPLIIELTDEQIAELADVYRLVSSEHEAGRTGMLLAQVGRPDSTKMTVGFIPHERAKELEGFGGNKSSKPESA